MIRNSEKQPETETDFVSETVKHGLEQDNLNKLARQIGTQLAQESRSPTIIIGCFRLFEAALIVIWGITFFWLEEAYIDRAVGHIVTIAALTAAISFFLHISGHYTSYSLKRGLGVAPNIFMILFSLFGIFGFGTLFLSMSAYYEPSWIIYWFLSTLLSLLAARLLFGFAISKWDRMGLIERRAILVGGGDAAEQLIRKLEAETNSDIRICGIFDDRNNHRSHPIIAGYPKLGNVLDVVAFARKTKIDLIILTLPLYAQERWVSILKHLWVLPVDIRLAAHNSSLSFKPRFYSYEEQSNIPMLALFNKPISDWNYVGKRLFDLLFASLLLLIAWPIMLVTAIVIKLESKGPIIFKQMRHGINNEEILIYKFRSMFHDQSDQKAIKMVTKSDPRVTRFGRFIRKTSIDELPQLLNVLKGQLSLVGPRPHAVTARTKEQYFAQIADGYFARHRVKPGITGWAQINGLRGEITSDHKIQKRTEYDLYYIENWSLWFDLIILLKTPLSLFNTENAY